jgi:hypothetical protein
MIYTSGCPLTRRTLTSTGRSLVRRFLTSRSLVRTQETHVCKHIQITNIYLYIKIRVTPHKEVPDQYRKNPPQEAPD